MERTLPGHHPTNIDEGGRWGSTSGEKGAWACCMRESSQATVDKQGMPLEHTDDSSVPRNILLTMFSCHYIANNVGTSLAISKLILWSPFTNGTFSTAFYLYNDYQMKAFKIDLNNNNKTWSRINKLKTIHFLFSLLIGCLKWRNNITSAHFRAVLTSEEKRYQNAPQRKQQWILGPIL